jgi:iron complex outermembrane receptor protein
MTYAFTDRLKTTLGLRYNDEEQDFLQDLFFNIPGVGTVPGGAAFAGGPISVSTSSDKILPKVAFQYEFSDNVNGYVQWSKGYKSGGLNLEGGNGLSTGTAGLYEPEEIDAYEVGLKSILFGGSVTANLAAFAYDYKGLQVTITVPPTTTLVQNADANVLGFEGELTWNPTEHLVLNAAATFLDAGFDGFTGFDDANPGSGVQDLDGKALPHAPEMTLGLGAEYEFELGGQLFSGLLVRGDAFYSDDVVLRYFGTPLETQDSYTLLNASATLVGADEKTSLRAFVRNIGDEEYLQNVTYIGAVGAFMGNYGAPRTWGVQVSRRF